MKSCANIVFLLFFSGVLAQQKKELFFDLNAHVLNVEKAANFRKWLTENPEIEVLALHGYCDSTDNNSYNKDLAMRRINSVFSIVTQHTVSISKSLQTKAVGETLVQSGQNEENRRVDLFYRQTGERKQTVSMIVTDTIDDEHLSAENIRRLVKGKKGDLVPIHNIYFYLNSETVVPESIPVLEELLGVMRDNPQLRIEIRGHICCNPNTADTKLSYRRAIFIFSYLKNKGIAMTRLGYKGFGSSNPIYKIPERNAMEREANRRVEIMIM